MKFSAILFTAFVAFATVNCHYLPNFGKGQLYEDIQYFLDLIPMDQVAEVVLEYAAEDTEFQSLLAYFQTSEFKTMLTEVEGIQSFHKFTNFLETNGVYIDKVLNKLNNIVGIPAYQQFSVIRDQITGGLKGLFEDVKALVSYDLFIHGYVKKMRESEAFRGFVAELKSQGNQQFVNDLYANQRWLQFRAMLVRNGLDVTLVEDIIYTVLGIEFPVIEVKASVMTSKALSRDIHEFMALVDQKAIQQVVLSYLEDDEVQRAIEYMYSDRFHNLVHVVENLTEYQQLVQFMEDSGLDMYGLLNKIHHLFGMEDYVPPKPIGKLLSNLGGLKAMVHDVVATLPLDKLKTLYNQKMQTSPAFQEFMTRLQSPEFQTIINTLYTNPLFLEMRQKVIDDGVDLEPFRDVIENMLGIHLPRP
ncbi:PREDICTED: uncharacterized protein LOC108546059 [Eufriesea mexicana]|uniref:uncharacterized protein LOC108546059 n=1 Tax=Eufriesea mexicana TaxID=516756 RepID=UPI00083BC50A|nr:PREDICTED: uncharacterized protein LOC108546059 [Eufriesea mexicana]